MRKVRKAFGYAVVDRSGKIDVDTVRTTRRYASNEIVYDGERCVRVLIMPAPIKRKKKS